MPTTVTKLDEDRNTRAEQLDAATRLSRGNGYHLIGEALGVTRSAAQQRFRDLG